MKKRIISSAQSVTSIFKELSILGSILKVKTQDGDVYYASLLPLTDLGRESSSELGLRFRDLEIDSKEIDVYFELDNHQFKCTLQFKSQNERTSYALPSIIKELTPRANKRVKPTQISEEPLFAELRGVLWICFGTILNFDPKHVSVLLYTSEVKPVIGETIQVKIYSKSGELQSSHGVVIFLRYIDENRIELVVSLTNRIEKTVSPLDRGLRVNLGQPYSLEVFWPDEKGQKARLSLADVGAFGLCGQLQANDSNVFPLGAICKFKPHNISGRLVWSSNDCVGFDLRTNSRDALLKWQDSMQELSKNSLLDLPDAQQKRKILSILLRSGYLKGKRLNDYSEISDIESLIPNSVTSRLWLRRYAKSYGEHGEVHISFSKVTDSSWMIQELGSSVYNLKVGNELLSETITDNQFS